ncbi:MAG: hypothetical protein JWP25_3058 [Bradyrhizobium sp.]|jgi:hypothetical protein|nr:hypothetical protein [Bradyrhizobium sp.]
MISPENEGEYVTAVIGGNLAACGNSCATPRGNRDAHRDEPRLRMSACKASFSSSGLLPIR